jgi:SAM-dependent MidA family methyltransferase
MTGVVIANELLDNLPVRIVERRDGAWSEVLVALGVDDALIETSVPASGALATEADLVVADAVVADGTRLPVPERIVEWLDDVAALLHRGEVVIVDYAAPAAELASRGQDGWLRTYREHDRGGAPLADPGSQDITADVPIEFVVHAAQRAGFSVVSDESQAEALGSVGIDDLVVVGAAIWRARAHLGDLEAIAGRSRAAEAAALTDPSGLGAHRVITLRCHPD